MQAYVRQQLVLGGAVVAIGCAVGVADRTELEIGAAARPESARAGTLVNTAGQGARTDGLSRSGAEVPAGTRRWVEIRSNDPKRVLSVIQRSPLNGWAVASATRYMLDDGKALVGMEPDNIVWIAGPTTPVVEIPAESVPSAGLDLQASSLASEYRVRAEGIRRGDRVTWMMVPDASMNRARYLAGCEDASNQIMADDGMIIVRASTPRDEPHLWFLAWTVDGVSEPVRIDCADREASVSTAAGTRVALVPETAAWAPIYVSPVRPEFAIHGGIPVWPRGDEAGARSIALPSGRWRLGDESESWSVEVTISAGEARDWRVHAGRRPRIALAR